MAATLTPTPGRPLFGGFKSEPSERVELRDPPQQPQVTSLWVPSKGAGGVSGGSADSGGMPWPRAHPQRLAPAPPAKPEPPLHPPLPLFACVVSMPFFPIARWISLCLHIFFLVLYLLGFY